MSRALLWPFLALQALFLRFCIHSTQQHLAECARDGLLSSYSLAHFRAEMARNRLQLLRVQQRMAGTRATASHAERSPALPYGEQATTLGDTWPAPLDGGHAASELLGADDEEARMPRPGWLYGLPLATAAVGAVLYALLAGPAA